MRASFAELGKRGFGWLTPEGRFVACDPYGHMSALRGTSPSLPEHLDEWADAVQALEDKMREDERSFANSVPVGEHPGWHAFSSRSEDAARSLRERLMVWLHRSGWVRLGTRGKELEAEGCPSVLRRQRDVLEDAAVALGLRLRETRTEWRPPGGSTVISAAEMRAGLPVFHAWAMEALMGSRAWRGGERERHVEFSLGWSVALDAFEPRTLPVRLPGLIRLVPRVRAGRWNREAHETREGGAWRWEGPFPPRLLADIEAAYFAPPPGADELRLILSEAGAELPPPRSPTFG